MNEMKCIHKQNAYDCALCWNKRQKFLKTDNELMDQGTCPACHSWKTEETRENGELIFICKDCGYTATT
jgi:hypothetical protein